VAVGGFDDNLAFLFPVSQYEAGLRVMTENLQGGHEGMPMRHEVNEFNPFNHCGAAVAAF